jgi:hypothetical protein
MVAQLKSKESFVCMVFNLQCRKNFVLAQEFNLTLIRNLFLETLNTTKE